MRAHATYKDLLKARRMLKKNGVDIKSYYFYGPMPPDWEEHMLQIDEAIKLFKREERKNVQADSNNHTDPVSDEYADGGDPKEGGGLLPDNWACYIGPRDQLSGLP